MMAKPKIIAFLVPFRVLREVVQLADSSWEVAPPQNGFEMANQRQQEQEPNQRHRGAGPDDKGAARGVEAGDTPLTPKSLGWKSIEVKEQYQVGTKFERARLHSGCTPPHTVRGPGEACGGGGGQSCEAASQDCRSTVPG